VAQFVEALRNKRGSRGFDYLWGRWNFLFTYSFQGGPGSSVGIATDYGLEGPGIESRWGEIFRCPDWP
jgi:hypothetical protein